MERLGTAWNAAREGDAQVRRCAEEAKRGKGERREIASLRSLRSVPARSLDRGTGNRAFPRPESSIQAPSSL